MNFYKSILKPLLFRCDSEWCHTKLLNVAEILSSSPGKQIVSSLYNFQDPSLEQKILGLHFTNPLGSAGGLDKNCQASPFFEALGFGFLDLAAVVAKAQPGNEKPRMHRLEADFALINSMGFPSLGADAIGQRLAASTVSVPRFANIGKSKETPIENAVEDYCYSFQKIIPFLDGAILNVSSPNTVGLRSLQAKGPLLEILQAIQALNKNKKPLLVKVSPDLNSEEIKSLVETSLSCGVNGFVATNTTLSRPALHSIKTPPVGGLSGRPIHARACQVVSEIYDLTAGEVLIIGVGGVFSALDVVRLMAHGAALVQIYTGLVYEGPALIKEIKRDLVLWMKTHGFTTIGELTGLLKKKGADFSEILRLN